MNKLRGKKIRRTKQKQIVAKIYIRRKTNEIKTYSKRQRRVEKNNEEE